MSHRDGIREKRNIYKGIFFYVTKFSEALCRVQVNSVVHESVMFSNVIVDRTFPHRSFVFSQSSCEVSASLTDVGGVAVRAIHLIYCSLSDDDFSD